MTRQQKSRGRDRSSDVRWKCLGKLCGCDIHGGEPLMTSSDDDLSTSTTTTPPAPSAQPTPHHHHTTNTTTTTMPASSPSGLRCQASPWIHSPFLKPKYQFYDISNTTLVTIKYD
ncbi:unnamed protein product [Arctogadus glacialis]